tara:strand:- start:5745 stop:5876 length:132 start_codon:yes stop_codon:yes gene_type:complete
VHENRLVMTGNRLIVIEKGGGGTILEKWLEMPATFEETDYKES